MKPESAISVLILGFVLSFEGAIGSPGGLRDQTAPQHPTPASSNDDDFGLLHRLLNATFNGNCETEIYGLLPSPLTTIVTCSDATANATLTAQGVETTTPTKLQACFFADEKCATLPLTGVTSADIKEAKQFLGGEQVTLFGELVLLLNTTYQGTCNSVGTLLLGAPNEVFVSCDLPNGVSANLVGTSSNGGIFLPVQLKVCVSNPTVADSCKKMEFAKSSDDANDEKQLDNAAELLQFGL